MRIVHVDTSPDESRIKVEFDSGNQTELWIQASVDLEKTADCWLFMMLPVCMGLAENLEVVGTVSETAIASFHNAQTELLERHPHLAKIELTHLGKINQSEPNNQSRNAGVFFSGGLDSTYTAVSVPEIDTLIAVWGFDIPIWNEKHWNLTTDLLEQHAAALGKKLIKVKTNIREVSNGLLSWGRDYHGTAIAAVGNSLSIHLKRVYVSAQHIEETKRWGQFPSLSRAFSTDYQEVIEYGAEIRTAKALALAENPSVRFIRVCYRNKTGLANCGECQKCLRTRLEFGLIQAKYRPLGLETMPSMSRLLKVRIEGNDYKFFKHSISFPRQKGYPKTLSPLIAISLARLKSMYYFKVVNPKKAKDYLKPPSSGLNTNSQ